MCPTAVTWSLRQQTCGKLVSTWIQWFFVTETAEQESLQGLQEIIQDHSPDTMTRSAAVVSLLTNDCLTSTCDHPEVMVSQHLQQSVPMPPPATAQNHRIKGMKGTSWIFKSWPPTSNHTTTWPLSNVLNVLSSLMMSTGFFFFLLSLHLQETEMGVQDLIFPTLIHNWFIFLHDSSSSVYFFKQFSYHCVANLFDIVLKSFSIPLSHFHQRK